MLGFGSGATGRPRAGRPGRRIRGSLARRRPARHCRSHMRWLPWLLVSLIVLCPPVSAAPALDVVLFGDWGAPPDRPGSMDRQRAVATALADWMKDEGVRPAAIVLLGDNFYGR